MFSQAKASGERLLEILEEPNEIKEKENPIKHIEIKGEVTFNNVTLKYAGDEKAALNNIPFPIPSGSVVGLIGATGSGKTSVTQLITRFYDVTEGEVLIDGINVKDFDLYTLRSKLVLSYKNRSYFLPQSKQYCLWKAGCNDGRNY